MHYFVRTAFSHPTPWIDALRRVTSLTYTGVDLFFVLSGYLIGGILLDARNGPEFYRPFYVRRFFRIVPLYAVLLATWFIFRNFPGLDAVNGNHLFDVHQVPLWTYFLFGQNIAMGIAGRLGPFWLIVTWSLAIEEQFYLCMPVAIRRLDPSRLLAVVIFLILAAPVCRLALLEFSPSTGLAAVFLPVCRMDALLFGVVAALLVRDDIARQWLAARQRVLAAAAGGFALIGCALSLGRYDFLSWIMTPFGYSAVGGFYFVLLLLALDPSDNWYRRCLRIRWLGRLGLVSYFVYLFHQPVNYIFHGWLLRQSPHLDNTGDVAVTGLALVTTLLLAALSWRYFEAPLIAFGRRTRQPGLAPVSQRPAA